MILAALKLEDVGALFVWTCVLAVWLVVLGLIFADELRDLAMLLGELRRRVAARLGVA